MHPRTNSTTDASSLQQQRAERWGDDALQMDAEDSYKASIGIWCLRTYIVPAKAVLNSLTIISGAPTPILVLMMRMVILMMMMVMVVVVDDD